MMENFQCGRWIADGQYMRDVPPEKLYQGFIETFTPGSNENACRILDDTGIYAITKQNWDSTFFGFDGFNYQINFLIMLADSSAMTKPS